MAPAACQGTTVSKSGSSAIETAMSGELPTLEGLVVFAR